jgi:hypothetical protein
VDRRDAIKRATPLFSSLYVANASLRWGTPRMPTQLGALDLGSETVRRKRVKRFRPPRTVAEPGDKIHAGRYCS